MRNKFLIFISLFSIYNLGFSQPQEYMNMLLETENRLKTEELSIEEKIDLYLQLSIEYSDISPIKADSLLNLGQTLLDNSEVPFITSRGKYITIKAHILISLGEHEIGFIELNKAADYFKSVHDTINWGVCIIDISNYYDQYLNSTTKVFEYAERSIELFKAVRDTVGIAGGYSILGTCNMKIRDYEHAIEQFTRAIDILEHVEGYGLPFVCYANRGLAYEGLEDYHNAKADHEKALELRSDNCLDECNVLEAKIIYYNLILNGKAKEGKSIENVTTFLTDLQNPFFKAQILEVLGDYYSETREWIKADAYYQQTLDVIESPENKLEILKKCALINERLTHFDLASEYYSTVVKLEDSLKFQNYKDQITHWQALYREEEKLERIKELQYQNTLKNLTITYQNRLSIVLYLGLFILGIFSIILFRQKKKINEKNKILLYKHIKLETDWQDVQKRYKSLKHKIDELNNTFKNEHIQNEKYDQSGLSPEQIKQFLSILMYAITEEKVYLDLEITLSKLAEKLGVNRSYLSQVINTEFGKNFNQFINHYRVLEACENLRAPSNIKYTIDFIAQKSGFKSISSFNTAFKKQVGVTPSYYRKEYSGIEKNTSQLNVI